MFGALGGGIGAAAARNAGRAAAPKLNCNSFDPDTPVAMADGSTKPIKDVQLGDKVTATDPSTERRRPAWSRPTTSTATPT